LGFVVLGRFMLLLAIHLGSFLYFTVDKSPDFTGIKLFWRVRNYSVILKFGVIRQ
jgi:hypothetical protein